MASGTILQVNLLKMLYQKIKTVLKCVIMDFMLSKFLEPHLHTAETEINLAGYTEYFHLHFISLTRNLMETNYLFLILVLIQE
jgi:hypothetical protein